MSHVAKNNFLFKVEGRTAAALRTLASTAGEREGKQVTLEIREGKAGN